MNLQEARSILGSYAEILIKLGPGQFSPREGFVSKIALYSDGRAVMVIGNTDEEIDIATIARWRVMTKPAGYTDAASPP